MRQTSCCSSGFWLLDLVASAAVPAATSHSAPLLSVPHVLAELPSLRPMALFAVPIVGGIAGGAYLWGAFHLTLAVDSATRSALASPKAGSLSKPPSTGQPHYGLHAASWAVAYAAGARALRPAFSRIPVPERVESAVQLARSIAPGAARHVLACTAAVALAAAGTAAYDVRLAQQQQQQTGQQPGRQRG